MYKMLGLYEDSLVQYDELDALFTQFVLSHAAGGDRSAHSLPVINDVRVLFLRLLLAFCAFDFAFCSRAVHVSIRDHVLEVCEHDILQTAVEILPNLQLRCTKMNR